TRDAIPERVRDLYDETEAGWVFALDVPGDEVPDLLVQRIEARADVLVSARSAELDALPATIEKTSAENAALRAELEREEIAAVVRDAARAEGVTLSAFEDVTAAAIADGLTLEGDRVITRDGRSAREWLMDRRQDRRHWFPPRLVPRRPLFN